MGRDHAETCERCGCERGGLNDQPCDCDLKRETSEKVDHARAITSGHMDGILRLFKLGAKITVLVRRPGEPEGDFALTNDAWDEIALMVDRSSKREDS